MVLHHGHSAAEGVGHSSSALLDDMGEFVAEQKLSVRRVRVVLAGREVDVRPPREGDRADSRGFGSDVDADIGEIRAEGGFHLGLNVARQRPSTGPRTKVYLESIHSGTACAGRLLLHGALMDSGINCLEGEGARLEDSLHDTTAAAGRAWLGFNARHRRNGAEWLRRIHAISLPPN
jgi:hypothetical protein